MKLMNKYTFAVLGSGQIEMKCVSASHVLHINEGHAKYDWLLQNQGRVITISESGRWNSSKDYKNDYGTSTQKQPSQASTTNQPIKVQLTKLADLNIDDSLFTPMQTGTIFDKFMSADSGILPASNIMAAGAPGVGKTTVLLEMVSRLHAQGKRVLFISAEMNEMDMSRYLRRFPSWATLPILFLNNYDEQADKVVEQTLMQGWDLVLTDSYTEVNDTIKDHTGWSRGKTEKWFLNLMTQHNKGLAKKFTSFLTILQLSKGGQFVGSNKLKHLTSAMLMLDWDGRENSGSRYMEFSKNRMGEVGKKLYFNLQGGVTFDTNRYTRDLFNDELLEQENQALEGEANRFDKIFGLAAESPETSEAE